MAIRRQHTRASASGGLVAIGVSTSRAPFQIKYRYSYIFIGLATFFSELVTFLRDELHLYVISYIFMELVTFFWDLLHLYGITIFTRLATYSKKNID